MNEEELDSIEELIVRKIQLADVTGGLTSSDKKFIALWNYTMQLQNNWNELKKSIENDIKEYEESEFHIKEPPILIQTKINILIQMQELEKRER